MWPPMFDPLANTMASPKLVSGITQAKIVTNCGEPSNEDEDYSERKHNPMMPQIVPNKKLYHDWRGRPPLIGNANRLHVGGQIVPISNGGGGPFSGDGNKPLRERSSRRWW